MTDAGVYFLRGNLSGEGNIKFLDRASDGWTAKETIMTIHASLFLKVVAIGLGIMMAGCNVDLENALRQDTGINEDEIFNPPMPEPEPVDFDETLCDSFDWAPYESTCGDLVLDRTDVTAGDVLTVMIKMDCSGGRIACDYAEPGLTEVDGTQVPEANAGYPGLYNYTPPRPVARKNGSVVQVSEGPHTIRFFLKLSAPNDCLTITDGDFRAEGPFVFLGNGTGYWSSVQSFRIRQSGI